MYIHVCMCGVHMSMHRQVNFMYNVYVEKWSVIKNEAKGLILLALDASYI